MELILSNPLIFLAVIIIAVATVCGIWLYFSERSHLKELDGQRKTKIANKIS